jgi:hypothetical protein
MDGGTRIGPVIDDHARPGPASELSPVARGAARSIGWQREALLLLALVAVALALRWPHLWTLPLWTDEGDEAVIALRIVRDGVLPLSNDNAYNGPLANYLVAAGLWLLGPSAWVPRLVMLAFGTLTVVPTYLLAREIVLAGPAGGLLSPLQQRRAVLAAGAAAALLVGTNAAHILVNSHIGWGHCLTPLFTTTAVWLLLRASRLRAQELAALDPSVSPHRRAAGRAGGAELVLSALCWSLAFQTHPTVAVLFPAVLLFLLWEQPGWLATPWLWLAGLAFLVGQAPTIQNAVRSRELVLVGAGLNQRSIYEGHDVGRLHGYLSNLLGVVQSVGATLGGLLNDAERPPIPLWHPLLVLGLLVTLVALARLWRSGRPLPGLLGLALLLGLPYLHGQFDPVISRSRYIAPIVPIIMAGWAACAVEAWSARARGSSRRSASGDCSWGQGADGVAGLGRGVVAPLLSCALVVVALGSLVSWIVYSDGAIRDGRTNAALIADYGRLVAARRPGESIAVDRALLRDWTMTQGRLGRVMSQWLELDGVPYTGIDLLPDGRFSGGQQETGGLAVLARGSVARASEAYALAEIAARTTPGSPPDRGYAIVRATRRP